MEERTSKGLDGTRKGSGVGEGGVDAEDSNILLSCYATSGCGSHYLQFHTRTCTLLRLDQAGCTVDADNEASSDLRVKRAAVTSLF